MTRLELIKILVGQARTNGFEFRRWFTTRLALPWEGADAAFALLESHRRYYPLLFSREFAEAFWKAGTMMTFKVSQNSYERRMPDGSIRTVKSAEYKRRTTRPEAWRYHLREMAVADEPLRYMRRYLHVEGDRPKTPEAGLNIAAASNSQRKEVEFPSSPTLSLARKAHERRNKLAGFMPPAPGERKKRSARLPGSTKKAGRLQA